MRVRPVQAEPGNGPRRITVRVFFDVLGAALIIANAAIIWMAFTKRRVQFSQVMTAPAGFVVRVALMTALLGVWELTQTWPVLGVWAAILVWELAVEATALVRRRARRSATVRVSRVTILGLEPGRWDGSEKVWIDGPDYDGPLRKELARTLQLPEITMSWNREDDRYWVMLSDGKDTRAWVNAALETLGRSPLPA